MKRTLTILGLALVIATSGWYLAGMTGESKPAPAGEKMAMKPGSGENQQESTHMEKAMFGAGCFWGVEATFRQIDGVTATAVGYAGGTTENPTYHDVCSDTTGHAEVVLVTYDPSRVSYDKLLEVFWNEHDPTQVNRQGPDYGTQYRSVIFYMNDAQKQAAEMSKKALAESGKYSRPIATSIEPAPTFYKAEEYHQQYLEKRGLSTCRIK